MKFFQTCDWHFEEASGRRGGADGVNEGWHDIARCLTHIVDAAIESAKVEPTVMFFGGDLARNRRPTPQTYAFVGGQIWRLHAAGVPVVAIEGNHDVPGAGEASALKPLANVPGFHLFDEPGIAWIHETGVGAQVRREPPRPVPGDTSTNAVAAIVCVPWLQRSVAAAQLPSDTPLEEVLPAMALGGLAIMRDLVLKAKDAGVPVMLGYHGCVEGGQVPTGQRVSVFHEPIISANDLGSLGVAGVMLGHIHMRQDLGSSIPGSPRIVYSSSIERLTFGDEKDTKGAAVWTLPTNVDDAATVDWIDTPARVFITVDSIDGIDYAGGEPAVDGAIMRVRLDAAVAALHDVDEREIERALLAAGAHRVTEVVLDQGITRVEHAAADLARTDPIEALREWLVVEHPEETDAWIASVLADAASLVHGDFKGGQSHAPDPVTPDGGSVAPESGDSGTAAPTGAPAAPLTVISDRHAELVSSATAS